MPGKWKMLQYQDRKYSKEKKILKMYICSTGCEVRWEEREIGEQSSNSDQVIGTDFWSNNNLGKGMYRSLGV